MDNSKEVWEDVPGYKGLYQVSNLGKVKTLERKINRKDGRVYTKKEKILSPGLAGGVYPFVILSLKKTTKSFRVHQLVAMAFLDHNINGMHRIIDHKDNNPKNNNLDNLQIVSQRENASKDKKNCSSKFTGVYYDSSKKKWRSSICILNKRYFLGLYINEYDAHLAYKKALKELVI